MRTPHLLLSLLALTAICGCGVREDLAFSYHKTEISDTQFSVDQQNLRNTPGVLKVFGRRTDDGGATMQVHVKEGYDLLIQEKIATLGYTQNTH